MADETSPAPASTDRSGSTGQTINLPDRWAHLRQATPARIGLGRNGDSMPLRPVLEFQLAHAEARDAVHAALDVAAMETAVASHVVLHVRSAVPDRVTYLKRPDLGRKLAPDCRARLMSAGHSPSDCVFVLADGLSAVAVERHGPGLLSHCLPLLEGLSIGPIVVATQARVALGDAIGEALGARLCVMLIGERPGLSVADSLGAYVTFDPKPGRRDSERNCISNIHTRGGLSLEQGGRKLAWLVREALKREVTGTALKDDETMLLKP